jgi:signal recognition particle receptor subunit beta
MDSATCDDLRHHGRLPDTVTETVKILVTGAFGVGKTTLIDAVSEIRPLRTEERITDASIGIDSLACVEGKTHTTVAMDFGRKTLSPELALYLFGIPGQQRLWGIWDGLVEGAIGTLVLVDLRRLETSFEVLDRLDTSGMPYTVVVNDFPDTPRHPDEEVRLALDLPPGIPLEHCHAPDRDSAVAVLISLVDHAIARLHTAEVPA